MRHLTLAVAAVVAASTAPAYAETIPVSLILTVDNETTVYEELEGTLTEEGIFRGEGGVEGAGFEVEWDISGDIDPAISVGIGITDFGAPSVFSFVFGLPIAFVDPPSVTAGSIGGSLTDGNGDGATLTSTGGQAVYTALVNSNPFQTLLNDPFSASADPFTTVALPVESFGLPGVTFPGPGVTVTDIGIQIQFALSGGNDSAAITANFVIEPTVIPEPASLTLIGLGLTGFAGRALRRRMKLA